MNSTLHAASPDAPAAEHLEVARALDARPSQPPQGGRWWYGFDRWLAAADVAQEQDEFVMA
jgi:hypothetical protein